MAASDLALSWSGGKDSALALQTLRAGGSADPGALITTVTREYGRISMHGVRRELLREQAQRAGLPLVEVEIPAICSNDVYEQRMGQALAEAPLRETATIAFGDLFLADIRDYREQRLRAVGKRATFPLWGAGPASTPVARTANFTPSSTPARSSTRRSAVSWETSWSARVSCLQTSSPGPLRDRAQAVPSGSTTIDTNRSSIEFTWSGTSSWLK